jgi:hypothetical protein
MASKSLTPRKPARQAAEIIGALFGCDVADIREMVYQPMRQIAPRVYSWNDKPFAYLCCPTKAQKCPKGIGKWEIVGTAYNEPDRPIYGSRVGDDQ